MAGPPIIEIREIRREPRRLLLTRALEVGRDTDGLSLADEMVSRRHLRLVPSPIAVSLVDLGSRNGTTVDGTAVTGRVTLEPGDVIRLGGTEIVFIGRSERPPARGGAESRMLGGPPVGVPPRPAPPPLPSTPSTVSVLWDKALGRVP